MRHPTVNRGNITDESVYDSLMSAPVLNSPQSGVLGMHPIRKRTRVVDAKIEIRPMMDLALTHNHRVVDGKEALEDPTCLKLDLRRGPTE
nr:2-oxo acid dehydrogenase subunit E2 [Singulisphaera sp. GP187]